MEECRINNMRICLKSIPIEKIDGQSDNGNPRKFIIRMTRPAESLPGPSILPDSDEKLLISIGTEKLLDTLFR